MDRVRMDKWLWASRFFKTRALAARACDLGRVHLNGVSAKPARDVKPGDRLRVETPGGVFEIDVLALSEIRGPAAAARALYRETEESQAARAKAAEEKAALPHYDFGGEGRPSKRDRRSLDRLRGRY